MQNISLIGTVVLEKKSFERLAKKTNGLVQYITVEESTSIQWVKRFGQTPCWKDFIILGSRQEVTALFPFVKRSPISIVGLVVLFLFLLKDCPQPFINTLSLS